MATTIINETAITSLDALLAKLREEPRHSYPYRVIVAPSSMPRGQTALLIWRATGSLFLVDPYEGPPRLEHGDCRLQDNPAHIARLDRWVTRWGCAVELHPTRTVFDGRYGTTSRWASDYFEALRGIMEVWLRGADSQYRLDFLRRLEILRDQALPRGTAAGWSDDARIYWRGRRMDSRQYMRLRAIFKDEAFIRACEEAEVHGDYSLLRDELNLAGNESFFDDDWTREISGGELVRADCGHVERRIDTVTTQDDRHTFCQACADEEFVYVTACRSSEEGYYHPDDVYFWESDGEYHLEPEPEPEPEDDEDGLLQGWAASTAHLAHDRSFTPTWYGDFTMGIELEVETSDYDRWDAVRDCDEQLNSDRHYAMFKRDGSLHDAKGFEIVTAARRLADHIEAFKAWEPYDGLRSWAPGNCGMHVHIDSRAFTALTLGKFLQFFNDPANAKFIRSIAGRHPDMDSQAQSYAARVECDSPNPARIKKGAGNSRYRIVNLTNLTYDEQRRLLVEADRSSKGSYSTVELRIFRGTLKKDRLLAQIEFAHATVLFCRVAGLHQLNGRGFLAWLGSVAGQYKHLARWFGVYVPRPTKLRPTPGTTSAVQRTTEV